MDPKSKALEKMLGDMDDMEGNSMFKQDPGKEKGVDITISIIPKQGDDKGGDEYPEGHDESMCHGGCAMHSGGIVPPEAEDDMTLPPFLRKKKLG